MLRLAGDGDRPEVLLTGDTLFTGSIGRTDLPGGSMEQELASIRDRILTRPDNAVVLPGHGPQSTVGAEKAGNPVPDGAGTGPDPAGDGAAGYRPFDRAARRGQVLTGLPALESRPSGSAVER